MTQRLMKTHWSDYKFSGLLESALGLVILEVSYKGYSSAVSKQFQLLLYCPFPIRTISLYMYNIFDLERNTIHFSLTLKSLFLFFDLAG